MNFNLLRRYCKRYGCIGKRLFWGQSIKMRNGGIPLPRSGSVQVTRLVFIEISHTPHIVVLSIQKNLRYDQILKKVATFDTDTLSLF
jgi:hypothetical protein